eukprot:TRINITY_DN34225_c0_g1_i1.p1 TRINITY_DN34225_c0_g1~~TRINITY_DN34225_c0_g1_i1.p1  ORF type:complete len:750 (-),score=119.31 TRINITY_DN34225_c0_g1_i1:24-2273(-)
MADTSVNHFDGTTGVRDLGNLAYGAVADDRTPANLLVLWRRGRALDELRRFRANELQGAVRAELGPSFVELDEALATQPLVSSTTAFFSDGHFAARLAVTRCVLTAAVVEVVGSGADLEEAVSACCTTSFLSKAVLRRANLRVHHGTYAGGGGNGGGRARRENRAKKQLQLLLGDYGHGNDVTSAEVGPTIEAIADYDNEETGPELWFVEEKGRIYLGWTVATGGAKEALSALKRRHALAPTSMTPEVAVLTANLAAVPFGGVVLDPCAGGGSLLQGAALLGAAALFGADVDDSALRVAAAGFAGMHLPPPALLRADVAASPWVRGFSRRSFDAIVCDVPYGIRAAVHAAEDADNGAAWRTAWICVLEAVLSTAARSLVGGGRIAVWVPHLESSEGEAGTDVNGDLSLEPPSVLRSHLARAACAVSGEGLELILVLHEDRRGGVQRALAVFECTVEPPPRCPVRNRGSQHGADRRAKPRQKQAVLATKLKRDLPYTAAKRAGSDCCLPCKGDAGVDVWRASWVGDCAAVRQYLDAGGAVNAPDPGGGRTPLQLASGYGRFGVVGMLLAARADASCIQGGDGPLHRAARRGHADVVRCLLDHESMSSDAVLQEDVEGMTSVFLAARWGHHVCLLYLIESINDEEVMRTLLAKPDSHGHGPLHGAAQFGRSSTAEVLLAFRADSCQRANDGTVPAHMAARWGHVDILRLLASTDITSLKICSTSGMTPLQEAEAWGKPECVAFLSELPDSD